MKISFERNLVVNGDTIVTVLGAEKVSVRTLEGMFDISEELVDCRVLVKGILRASEGILDIRELTTSILRDPILEDVISFVAHV